MSINAEDVPIRQHMEDPEIVWRHGSKPDYTDVNEKFIKERTRKHKQGSLERIVEDLVKTWEMESSHKTRKRVKSLYYVTFVAISVIFTVTPDAGL
jgi:hypothetical protein